MPDLQSVQRDGEDAASRRSPEMNVTPMVPAPQSPHQSLPALLRWRVGESSGTEAFRCRTGSDNAWESVTWAQLAERVELIAAGLIELGVTAGDCVALAASTTYEWICADLAVLSAGAVTTTIYPTSTAADVEHILENSQACVAIAEGPAQLEPVLDCISRSSSLRHVVGFHPDSADESVTSLPQLVEAGRRALAARPDIVTDRVAGIEPDAPASILYTSGTTGRPKGVVATHASWLSTVEALQACGLYSEEDVHLLWLPLAHAFGKLLEFCAIRSGHVTAVDGDVERIATNLAEVRPTFMCSVPRVLEKVYGRANAQAADSQVKKRLLAWAVST